jgi:hypothetical protein
VKTPPANRPSAAGPRLGRRGRQVGRQTRPSAPGLQYLRDRHLVCHGEHEIEAPTTGLGRFV